MKKHIKNLFLLAAICLTVACKEQLYTGLTEKEANQMQALLLSNDVSVSKEMDKSGNMTLSVEKEDFVRAITILNNNGFPKKKFADIEVIFPPSQLVASPSQENAKINYLKEQDIERLLSKIPGVIDCSVSLNVNNNESQPSSAAVLVISSPEVNLAPSVIQIKNLVKNSVDDLKLENISVVIKSSSGQDG
ncbi:type III secretion system LEE inner membrane ring protein EscJ [Escherichia coli]|uniref:Lipoprotein n=1 Tax=Escherichia coli TaxID=562 RepID=A0A826J1F2_ECOLX|nr:type III secretion system LEE inner membrane ring protein EscJ [Escherichia coli]EFA4418307.1 type III secretion system LEE inner membrane ring protein EscJ [Escherichia coli]